MFYSSSTLDVRLVSLTASTDNDPAFTVTNGFTITGTELSNQPGGGLGSLAYDAIPILTGIPSGLSNTDLGIGVIPEMNSGLWVGGLCLLIAMAWRRQIFPSHLSS